MARPEPSANARAQDMLRRAAKVAKIDLAEVSQDGRRAYLADGTCWQPFDDGDDALQLQIAAQLHVKVAGGEISAGRPDLHFAVHASGNSPEELKAALRQVVVRAAAAVWDILGESR